MFRHVLDAPGKARCKRGALIRRHFFLIAAIGALIVMVVLGGLKLAAGHGHKGGAPAAAAGKAAARPVEVSEAFAVLR